MNNSECERFSTMSQSSPEQFFHRTKSFSGACVISHCLEEQIAMCNCEVLQPMPGANLFNPPCTKDRKKKRSSLLCHKTDMAELEKSGITNATENFHFEEVLIPAAAMTLCLWKDEKEYHLTVFRPKKNELFLDLPLSGLQKGKITYDNSNVLWHEVTILDSADGKDDGQKPRRLAFSLKSSVSDSSRVKNFNRYLATALEDTYKSAGVVEGQTIQAEEDVQISSNARSCCSTSGQAAIVQDKGMASAPPANVPVPKVQGPMPGVEAASLSPGFLLVPLEASAAQKNAEELEAAILAGNVERAQKIVKILAERHAPVNVKFDSTSHERMAKDKEISVTVHVEDRESPSIPLSDIKVRPSDTILDLKRMFWGKFGFPVEVQKWIIGHRICSDEQTLNKCEVNTSGHTLYLYLLSARAVNISRSTYRPKCQCRNSQDCETLNTSMASSSAPPPPTAGSTLSQTQGPQEFTLTPPQGLGQGQISPQGSVSRQPSQKSIHSSSSSLAASSSARSLSESQDLDPRSGPVSSHRGSFTRQSQSQGEPLSAPSVVRAGGGGDDGRGRLQAAPVVSHGAEDDDDDESSHQGWHCEKCTLINQPTRPGCEMCGAARPASYKIPANYIASVEELARLDRDKQLEAAAQQLERCEREQNYQLLLQAESNDLVTNITTFSCPICFEDISPGEGIVLRECLHHFCRSCLTEAVRLTEEAELRCPYQDDEYSCNASLQNREVRALVPDEMFERYLRRSLDLAESQAANSYHCKTPDCQGWCIYEDLLNFFKCPVCGHENCLTCRTIHEGLNCKQYQDDLHVRAANDKAALQTQIMLQEMVDKGDAMPCPQCQVIVQKKDGCDWIRCSICKTEICWVTKGPRWGPKGDGDTSGGCKCRVNGRRCHPKCSNCH